jgi:hypothetical protein
MHGSMQGGAPVINQAHRGGMLRLAFLSAVISLVVSFAAAAAPIPLYNIYRAEDGFTNFGISMAIVPYSVGTLAALLVLGRLSNHLGRRLTAIASLGLLLLGCLLLLNVHDIGTLHAGRVLMGIGTGLANGTLTPYIVDAAPARPEWLASVASSHARSTAARLPRRQNLPRTAAGHRPRRRQAGEGVHSDRTRLRLLCRITTSVSRCHAAGGIPRYGITPRGERQ